MLLAMRRASTLAVSDCGFVSGFELKKRCQLSDVARRAASGTRPTF